MEDNKSNKEEKKKEMLKDKASEILGIVGFIAGLTGICISAETSSQEFSCDSTAPSSLAKGGSMSVQEGTASTAANGPTETVGMTTTIGMLISTTSGEPDVIHIGGLDIYEDSSGNIITRDVKDSSRVENNAEKIYNTFNKTHEIKDIDSGLMIKDKDTARMLDELLKSGTKDQLYQALTAIQEVLEEKDKEENITLKLEK